MAGDGVQAFLEEGRFQKWEDAQAAGVRKSSKETFKRTVGRNKPVRVAMASDPCSRPASMHSNSS